MGFALSLRLFLPFASGYLFSSIFRSIGGVIAPDLVRDLGLDASGLGFAVSAYYVGATLLQVPYGILLDRYDPRRVYATMLCICTVGIVVTASAHNLATLTIGRAMIALGTSASAVTSYRIYAMWLPAERLALANGLTLATGGLGVLAGTLPAEWALGYVDWRQLHLLIAAVVIASAILVVTVVPKKAGGRSGGTLMQQVLGLGAILKHREFWRVTPMMTATVGTLGSFSGLWAGPWARDVAGFDDTGAANVLLMISAALTLGAALTGPVASLARRAGLTNMGVAVTSAILSASILFVIVLQWTPSIFVVLATWFLLSFVATMNMVMYAALGPIFPIELAGRLNACLSLAWMLGAFLIQNIYGIVLDHFPSSGSHYAVEGHRVATAVLLGLIVVSIAWYFLAGFLFDPARRRA